MKILKKQLNQAVDEQIISSEQADALYAFYQGQAQNQAHFSFTHVLYYLGGLLALGAMTLFMNLGWESFGGLGILSISLCYALLGLGLTEYFTHKQLLIPAGLCAAFVVGVTPIAVYGLQIWLGLWPEDDTVYREYHSLIKWHWIYMELATLLSGALLAWRYRYPFLVMPMAVTLWYMSMDIAAMLSGGDLNWEIRQQVSIYFGLIMLALAFWADLRSRYSQDYAFWLYIFGVLAFWGGMSMQNSDSELFKFLYFCINLLMIGTGVLLMRRVFVIFGALGSCFYLGHLAQDVFKDSWFFPISLTAIGLMIIYLGILWQKHEHKIAMATRQYLPIPLKEMLDARQ